ncbi:AraC family transcriptional regulator [Mucilaginibacter sp. HD30]
MLTSNKNIPVKDKLNTGQLIKVSLMKEVIKPTRLHRHADYHELILLSQGSGFHEVDGQHFEVEAPVAYYLRPGQTHSWNFTALPKGYVILFREEMLLKQDITFLFNISTQILLQPGDYLFVIAELLRKEFENAHASEDSYAAYVHLLITKLSVLASTEKPNFVKHTHVFQQFKRLVDAFFAEGKALSFYAGELNITIAVLNQTCKKVVGKTPTTIINERILLEAKLLLSATSKSVNEIGDHLGFADSPHFIKFFRKSTNLTPGAYRELAIKQQ